MRPNAVLVFFSTLVLANLISSTSGVFYAFSDKYIFSLSVSCVVFFIGYLGGRVLLTRGITEPLICAIDKFCLRRNAAYVIYISLFLLFSALLMLDRFLTVGPGFMQPDMVMQYRIIRTDDAEYGAIKGLSIGNFFLFNAPIFLSVFRDRARSWLRVTIIVLFIVDMYLSTARSAVFMSILTIFYFSILRKKIGAKLAFRIALIGLLLYGAFSLIGEIVGKSDEGVGFTVYAAAPLHAFDHLLNYPKELGNAWLSFSAVKWALNSLHLYPTAILPEVYTPLPTNVYTLFGVYFTDYGEFGLYCWMLIFGLFSGLIEAIGRVANRSGIDVWIAMNFTILTLSIFYDYYTTSGVVWMTFALAPIFFVGNATGKLHQTASNRRQQAQ